MKKLVCPLAFGVVVVLETAVSVRAQDYPVPGEHAGRPQDVLLKPEGIGCAGECIGADCCPSSAAYRAERIHLRYLKSIRGGTAEYTHRWNQNYAQQTSWHGGYYHTAWGSPLALVVPPTSEFQTRWGWGVGQTTVIPIYHQFARPYPGAYEWGPAPFRATPWWPSHTDQFGVYYVRGPW